MSCPYAITSATSQEELSKEQRQPLNEEYNSNDQPSPIPSNPPAPNEEKLTPMEALQLAKSSCPAFKSACPFRDVQDSHSMKKALENMPPSHLHAPDPLQEEAFDNDRENANDSEYQNERRRNTKDINLSLRVALQHVHAISQSLQSSHSSDISYALSEEEEKASETNGPTEDSEVREDSKYQLSNSICPYKTIVKGTKTDGGNGEYESLDFVNAMEEFSFNAILAKLIHDQEGLMDLIHSEEQHEGEDITLTTITTTTITTTTTTTTTKTRQTPVATNQPNTLQKKTDANRSLSNSLKVGTAKSHSSAESVHFVKEFIKGNINQTLYSILITNLFWVYKYLEKELEQHAPVEFPTLHKRELYRTSTLQDDLEYFLAGLDFDEYNSANMNDEEQLKLKIPPSKATKDYMHRIQYIAKEEPLLLLSHAYTRYLGDLSGGKVLARVAKRALNLKSSNDTCDGLAFYHFSEIPSVKVFKDEYRCALDNLDLSTEQIERLVAEANVAFALNMRIFEELDVLDGVQGAMVRGYDEATCYYEDCIKTQLERKKNGGNNTREHDNYHTEMQYNNAEAECPFAKLGGPNPHVFMKSNADSKHTEIQTHEEVNDKSSKKKDRKHSCSERCPWPFVFFHDPKTGMQDWQTWLVIGLFLCWTWNFLMRGN